MKTLIALLLLASPAVAQTPLDISIAIAIAEAEAAQTPAVARSPAKPAEILKLSEGQLAESKAVRSGYPTRRGYWTGCPNWRHLTVGEHAGKFDHAWLQSLSYAEIQSLHSDDHEGRVKWQYAVRPSRKPSTVTYQESSSGCPGGVCPSSSRSRGFRLFRR